MGTVSVNLAPREADHTRDHTGIRWMSAIGALVAIIGLLVVVLHTSTRMNVKDLFVDPTAKANLAAHVGVFSHLGVLALWTGATLLVASVLITPRTHGARFVALLAGLLAWMALDDLYLVHEEVGGVISRVLLPAVDRRLLEGVVFAVIGVAWIAFLVRFHREIRRGPGLLLLVALAALGASVGVDIGEILVSDWVDANKNRNTAVAVIEDLLKFGGLLLLAVYAGTVARDRIQGEMLHG